jgi:hypothetical protein
MCSSTARESSRSGDRRGEAQCPARTRFCRAELTTADRTTAEITINGKRTMTSTDSMR